MAYMNADEFLPSRKPQKIIVECQQPKQTVGVSFMDVLSAFASVATILSYGKSKKR